VRRRYIPVVVMVAGTGSDPLSLSATALAARLRRPAALACLIGVLATGCRPHPNHIAATAPSHEVVGWRSLGWEDRHDTMTFAVLPEMGRLFQRFHGSAWPDLTCRSCHGADGEARAYRMPGDLPPLDASGLPEGRALDAELSRTLKFMRDEVTPRMAEILDLNVAPQDDASAFSCFNCHPRANATGAPR